MAEVYSTREQDIETLWGMIRPIKVAMLTTATADGTLRSRPMLTPEALYDGDLWFLTEIGSAKVNEVLEDQHVNLSFSDPGHSRYVSISGTATVVRDAERVQQMWRPIHQAWFPKGPTDPNVGLLRIDIHMAEYWDGPAGRMVQLLGLMQAFASGRNYQPGEGGKVTVESPKASRPKGEDWPKSEGTAYIKPPPIPAEKPPSPPTESTNRPPG